MIICIVGPTGVGKTKLSIELAKNLNGEIINADSTQVYKDMNVATAKVTEEEKQDIPHHLFDIKDIKDDYTVYDYQKDCRKKIEKILKQDKIPILVGGTGLYIKASLFDYKFDEENCNCNYDEYLTDDLYKMLIGIDRNTEIHPNNRKRIIRALNYYNSNNAPLSSKEKSNKLLYETLFIGLTCDRKILYDKINTRVDMMVKDGLINEAKKLYKSGIRSKAVMTPIGYKELFEYFNNNISLEEAIDLIKKRSRNYAKRQYTWNNHQIPVCWFDVDFNNFSNTVNIIINYINIVTNKYNVCLLNDLIQKYGLTPLEKEEFIGIIRDIFYHDEFQKRLTSDYLHHANITLGEHILNVALKTYLLSKKYKHKHKNKDFSVSIAVKIAMMHDLYELPWQNNPSKSEQKFFNKHGFRHPIESVINSNTWFPQFFECECDSKKIIDGIVHHMYPLPVTRFNSLNIKNMELKNEFKLDNLNEDNLKILENSTKKGRIGKTSFKKSKYKEGKLVSRADKSCSLNNFKDFSSLKALITGKNKKIK